MQILSDLRDKGSSSALETLWELDFERKPVTIQDFLSDPYYLGDVGAVLFPLWREELHYVCHPASGIVEWVLTGAIGGGKTFSALIAQLYKGPYWCSCLRDPAAYYGLAPGSEIVFGMFNATLANVGGVDFTQMLKFVDCSRYFRECCPRTPSKTLIAFPKKSMQVRMGSSELHALGANMFSFMLDEVNFMRVNIDDKERDQAYQLYNHAQRRMKSRFHAYGTSPGLACIVSSRKAQSSFLEEHMKAYKDNPEVHVSDYALWDVKGRHLYAQETFRVAVGNKYHDSKILDIYDQAGNLVESEKRGVAENQQVVEVPMDFYQDFCRDIDGALRDQAGIPTFGVCPLIISVASIYDCIDETLEHPFSSEAVQLPLSQEGPTLTSMMDWNKLCTVHQSAWRMRHHPGEPRCLHIDLGLSGDCAALACAHRYDYITGTRYDALSGQVIETLHPKIWVDFMLRIKPTMGTQIDLTKIVGFLLNLRNYGVPVVKITFDGFQSAMAIQILQKSDQMLQPRQRANQRLSTQTYGQLGAGYLSVDKDDVPYTLLRDSAACGALCYYRYTPFLDEVLALEHDIDKHKVDHPPKGSKDVSDAVAGAVYNCATLRLPVTGPTPEGVPDRPPLVSTKLERDMQQAVFPEYPGGAQITGIYPPPTPTPSPTTASGRQPVEPQRSLSSGLQNALYQIAMHGRVEKDK